MRHYAPVIILFALVFAASLLLAIALRDAEKPKKECRNFPALNAETGYSRCQYRW